MIGLVRRLLGLDRMDALLPPPPNEQRDRSDALRSAERARELAKKLRNARRRELAIRLEVRTRQ